MVTTFTTGKTTGYNTNLVVITSTTQIRQQKATTSAKCNTSVAKNTTKTKVSIKIDLFITHVKVKDYTIGPANVTKGVYVQGECYGPKDRALGH